MRISGINSCYTPQFTAWERKVTEPTPAGKGERTKHLNNTYFYRDDLHWPSLRRYLLNKYEHVNKVNLYSYASSDGSEAYTLIMDLLSNGNENTAKKFFPIIAKDYDKDAIGAAESGEIYLNDYEIQKIGEYTKKNLNDFMYFDKKGKKNNRMNYCIQVKPILSDNVVFECADILEDYKKIKPHNTVVFARNFWPYLREEEVQRKLGKDLYNQLGYNSAVVIGGYDLSATDYKLAMYLLDAGFRHADMSNFIFEK